MKRACETWVTGIGIVSSLGEGGEAHWSALSAQDGPQVCLEGERFAPYPVHPLDQTIDGTRFIPTKADQKQMGLWQRLGVHAAGLALEDAGILGNEVLLDRMDLVVAAGNGERDVALDGNVLEMMATTPVEDVGRALNTELLTGLRPTLYLGELSNLLAGNIQILLKVTGSSRTLKGEEIAGVSAVEDAVRRIESGECRMALVGGALNAERSDLLLGYELGGDLWRHPFAPVWQRAAAGGGMVLGSAAAFLVLEARAHAEARGSTAYAKIAGIGARRARRQVAGDIGASLSQLYEQLAPRATDGALAALSGASGAEPATSAELAFLRRLQSDRASSAIRAYGSVLGHAVEAHFPLGLALACLPLKRGDFYPPFADDTVERPVETAPDRILVTSVGHWRGEGLAILERALPEGVGS